MLIWETEVRISKERSVSENYISMLGDSLSLKNRSILPISAKATWFLYAIAT
jgi:hypothetical protein